MNKSIGWMIIVFWAIVLLSPDDALCLGRLPPSPGGGGGGPGPVSAPEPGILTLAGMAVSAGVGYLIGRRKK